MKNTIRASRWSRVLAFSAVIGTAGALAGCDEFLTASNPGLIQVDRLTDTSLVDLMANSTIGIMQDVYSWMADYGSVYTDETRNHGTFSEEGFFDQRRVFTDNGTLSSFQYSPLMSGSCGRNSCSRAKAPSASPGPKFTTAGRSGSVPFGSCTSPSAV